MQRVFHEYRNKSRVFNMLEGLYAYVSDSDYMFEDVLWLDTTFKPLCDILASNLFIFNEPLIKEIDLPKIECVKCDTSNGNTSSGDNKEITVCLSGGKDSVACAYYYIKRGYKVHLYHATGINKAYGDEKNAAKRIADYLGCDLFIEKFRLEGTHQFIEHPLKNYLIANGAIHYCLANKYTPRIAFGNFNQSVLEDNPFEVCAGDCIEMWDAYRPIIQKVLPEFDIEIPLKTNADTFEILSEDWELFKLSVSCMSPFRFRAHWKHRTEEKYNVRIFDNRCGCCWKCCLESMWLMDTNKVEHSATYYRHCWDILERTMFRENGHPAKNVQTVWDNYMFYPIEQSKEYDYLIHKKIKKGFH